MAYASANVQRRRDIQKAHRRRNHLRLLDYLSTHPCVDCGEADPVVLEFDHIDRANKKQDITRMVTGMHYGWERIVEEIAKCVVRCANCHRKKTYREAGWTNKTLDAT